MAQGNYDAALKAVWTFDGAVKDSAPGETFATTRGVTEETWSYAAQLNIVPYVGFATATEEQCSAILKALCWNGCRCDELPAGVDLLVFNDAMLSGAGHTKALLQRCVDVEDDGILGPVTMAAVRSVEPLTLCARISTADMEYLSALKTAPLYLRGWTRREGFMSDLAHQWIDKAVA